MSKHNELLVEAAERLELLGFDFEGDVVKSMLSGERPKCSDETLGIHSIVRELTDEEWRQITEFQKRFGMIVYHVIHSNFREIGILDAYLYFPVPLDDDECDLDRKDLKEGYPLAYVQNLSYPEFSEFGSIGVKFEYGSVVRTW